METFSALLAICAENSPVPGDFPAQRPVTRSFDVFFDLRLNKRLSNNGEAGDLRRYRIHYDVTVMMVLILFRQEFRCMDWSVCWSNAVWPLGDVIKTKMAMAMDGR